MLKVVSMYGEHTNSAASLLQPYLPHHSALCQQPGSLGMRLSQKHVHQIESGQHASQNAMSVAHRNACKLHCKLGHNGSG